MKKLLCIFLLTSMLMLSSCSILNEGLLMPSIYEDGIFENDTWLAVDGQLINKADGTVCRLEFDRNITIPERSKFYYDGRYSYKFEFLESSVNEYTFLYAYGRDGTTALYYECMITYDYNGKETDRLYLSEELLREEMWESYKNKSHHSESFYFSGFGLGSETGGAGNVYHGFMYTNEDEASEEEQAILSFAGNLYESYPDASDYLVCGLARTFGNEIWFSASGSKRRDSIKADILISGIPESYITAYDRETNEFRTVFKYEQKRAQIIDFDESGAYVLSSSGELSYVDFETGKSTDIYGFPDVDRIIVSEKYICVKYHRNGYSYFVYEKGGDVVANGSYLD